MPMAGKYEKRKQTLPSALTDQSTQDGYVYDGGGQVERARSAAADYPAYESPYASRIEGALKTVTERPEFTYNPASDPLWQAYRKQYAREGSRATEDTLGRYAAMTGGVPSTAAVTAAQQAGDYYRAQMADAIPELYRMAYAMYSDETERAERNLSALRALDAEAYARWGDGYTRAQGAWKAERDAENDAYARWRDRVGDAVRERAYSDERADRAEDTAYRERAYADARADADWERAYKTGEAGPTLYAYGDGEPYVISSAKGRAFVASAAPGQTLTGGDGSAWVKNADGSVTIAKNGGIWTVPAPAAPSGSGSGRSSGGGSGSAKAKPELTAAQVMSALREGVRTQKVLDAYEYYYGEPYPDAADGGAAPAEEGAVDMASVLALGYGPISAERLSELVESGAVEKYADGGVWRFRRRAAASAPVLPSLGERLTGRFA